MMQTNASLTSSSSLYNVYFYSDISLKGLGLKGGAQHRSVSGPYLYNFSKFKYSTANLKPGNVHYSPYQAKTSAQASFYTLRVVPLTAMGLLTV